MSTYRASISIRSVKGASNKGERKTWGDLVWSSGFPVPGLLYAKKFQYLRDGESIPSSIGKRRK
jgi:hypothetical protein